MIHVPLCSCRFPDVCIHTEPLLKPGATLGLSHGFLLGYLVSWNSRYITSMIFIKGILR
jgi:hypothetical protein